VDVEDTEVVVEDTEVAAEISLDMDLVVLAATEDTMAMTVIAVTGVADHGMWAVLVGAITEMDGIGELVMDGDGHLGHLGRLGTIGGPHTIVSIMPLSDVLVYPIIKHVSTPNIETVQEFITKIASKDER